LILAFSTTAHAKLFKNAYVSFELPDKWDCVLEQTEWVCRPNAQDIAQQAIIILTAKEVGPNDSLPQYMTHLKAPRAIASRSGQPMQSQVMKVEQRNIANQPWIDGMHLGSEVQNYYTRYLATTKDKIAVLVTFSAHKLAYTKFSNDFFRAIESLRVVATKSLLSGNGSGVGGGPGSETLGINSGIGLGGDGEPPPEEGAGGKGAGIKAVRNILGLAVILAAIGIFLVLKRGKKKKKR
jgi:hypothetical protein